MKELITAHGRFLRKQRKIKSKIHMERGTFSWKRATFCNGKGERKRSFVAIHGFVGLVLQRLRELITKHVFSVNKKLAVPV